MELLCPSAKRRRSEDLAADEPPQRATEAMEAANLGPKEPPPPPPPDADGGGDVDRISGLPDAVLGEIVSLLSTKEAGRTQILASRWRHVWLASPLVLDGTDLHTEPYPYEREKFNAVSDALASAVSRILSAHPGPGRRFCVPPHFLQDRLATVDAWLSSPALHNLQELDFWAGKDTICRYRYMYMQSSPLAPPPASTFRFSATLLVATLGKCELLNKSVEGIHFPHLKQLGLEDVSISEDSLHTIISSCPVLECLLLEDISGVGSLQISSNSLRSIGVGTDDLRGNPQFLQEIIIVDAPCLERFFYLGARKPTDLTVISAPKLDTIGRVNDGWSGQTRLVFGTTSIQGFKVVRLTTALSNIKTLAGTSYYINLDTVIELMKCFPCLEKLYLYIKACNQGKISRRQWRRRHNISGEMNRWHRKHRDFIKSSDIHLKKIVMTYRGIRSQINFASFFLLNARELELMSLEVAASDYNDAYFAEQYRMLQMEKRASGGARLHFTKICTHGIHVNHVRDLSAADPFECRW